MRHLGRESLWYCELEGIALRVGLCNERESLAAGIARMDKTAIETVILESIRQANLARDPDRQLDASPQAPIFGPGSTLDSLGLVALLMDIEEAFQDRGCEVTLSDARAMSQSQSPFRDVPALVAYVAMALADRP